jgi:hypothetical protein
MRAMQTTDLPYSFRQIVIVAAVVFVLVAHKLSQVAIETGNFEGMWFSLAHTAIVAIGVILALRETR